MHPEPRRPGPTSRATVSVVIPVKDDAPALERCLRALDAQEEPPLEVVVVDNGSVDESVAVARAHGARVVVEPAPGIGAAAAAGYDAALGDLIARCDADTVAPRDWTRRVREAFVADPGLDALTGHGEFYDVPRWRAVVHGQLYLWSYYLSMHAALAHRPVWGSAMALPRTRWEDARGRVHRWDPEVHDDVDLALALGATARVRHDRHLRVQVSGRSLVGWRQTRRRFRRAFHTLDLHRDTPPWDRWRLRMRARQGVVR